MKDCTVGVDASLLAQSISYISYDDNIGVALTLQY